MNKEENKARLKAKRDKAIDQIAELRKERIMRSAENPLTMSDVEIEEYVIHIGRNDGPPKPVEVTVTYDSDEETPYERRREVQTEILSCPTITKARELVESEFPATREWLWETSNGSKIMVKDIAPDHLGNILSFMRRNNFSPNLIYFFEYEQNYRIAKRKEILEINFETLLNPKQQQPCLLPPSSSSETAPEPKPLPSSAFRKATGKRYSVRERPVGEAS